MKTAIFVAIVLVSLALHVSALPKNSKRSTTCTHLGESCGGADGTSDDKICLSERQGLICEQNECKDKEVGDKCGGTDGVSSAQFCIRQEKDGYEALKCAGYRNTCFNKNVGDPCTYGSDGQEGVCGFLNSQCSTPSSTCHLTCKKVNK